MSNVTISRVFGNNPDHLDSYIIYLENLNIDNELNSTVSNINVQNSNIGIIDFIKVNIEENNSAFFNIIDITYSDSLFGIKADLILFESIETSKDFTITINTLNFENIKFIQGGNLLKYQSQMVNQMIINDLSINNITNGRIYLEAFNLQNLNLLSKMKINNLTTDNINTEYSSLILMNEGAELEIRNSEFKNIYCYEEGAIIFAGYQKSVTSIYDSLFINNAAIQGSLFNIESESVVKLYN